MALVERLMALETPRIHVHTFFAAIHERVGGALTRQQVLDMFALDAAAIVDYDALAALAPSGGSALAEAQRAHYINRVHAVFILAESRMPGYTTPAEVRAKFGI